jgi:hypothetical protein
MSQGTSSQASFDLSAVFEVDDYMVFYGDDLTDERSEAEVAALVKLLELDSPKKILDLACGCSGGMPIAWLRWAMRSPASISHPASWRLPARKRWQWV